ncbi:hypothetical protein BTUL_0143g00240 [Botrytis tulipae]|uniref:Uncharacterized protein n=1 Tax=Botrytis tulipae TaxID=87230 RepID=A0A4Z1EIF4_9HELO|nr:hypothetical protein BTUL_0143g00240 [Botrytis tulipae]
MAFTHLLPTSNQIQRVEMIEDLQWCLVLTVIVWGVSRRADYKQDTSYTCEEQESSKELNTY